MRTARSSFRGGTLGTPFPRLHLPVSTQGMRRFQIDAIFLRLLSWNCFQKSPSSLTFLWVFWWVWKTKTNKTKKETTVFQKSIRRIWGFGHRTKMSWKFYHRGGWFSLLNDVFLFHRFVPQYTFVTRYRKINCLKTAVQYQLTDSSPCCGRLLGTITAKVVYENKIPYLGMTSYYAILIQCVVFIVTSPGALTLYHESVNYNSYQTFKVEQKLNNYWSLGKNS